MKDYDPQSYELVKACNVKDRDYRVSQALIRKALTQAHLAGFEEAKQLVIKRLFEQQSQW